ncbi:MAG TPA: HepT-like ribonuclease domain-containing protein [Planctomycetota bacterium]|nr:HepT-like ribonuclease domain-containing protein [Planctomycetota bacterium]
MRDIVEACRCIEEETASVEMRQFSTDRVLRAAIERWFTIVGEAGARLAKLEPAFERELPDLRRAIGFRNVIMHQYDELDFVIVWQATREDVPRLRSQAERLLAGP